MNKIFRIRIRRNIKRTGRCLFTW